MRSWAITARAHGGKAGRPRSLAVVVFASVVGPWAAVPAGAAGDALTLGRALYEKNCVACHGPDGSGPLAPAIHSPSLSNPDVLAVADDDFYRFIIARGRSGTLMPAWGEKLSREEIDAIVAYIRSWEPRGPRLDEVLALEGDPVAGRATYRGFCAGCHGLSGEGGIGVSLRSATFLGVVDDRFLAESILRGRPGTAMPSWKQLSAQAIRDVIAYIRTWQPEPPRFRDVRRLLRRRRWRAEAVRVGERLFADRCAACHGRGGEGGYGPSLTSPDFLGVVDDRFLYRAIVHGREGTAMPAWRHLPAADVAALIAYLRSFPFRRIRLERRIPEGDPGRGESVWRLACRSCHGERGSGGVGPRIGAPGFLASVSDAVLFHWIAHGRAGTAMRGFLEREQGPLVLDRQQIADVIAYLRSVGASGDVPVQRSMAGNAALGRELFRGTCAGCHGEDGEGASGPQLDNPSLLGAAPDGFFAATIVLGREGTPMRSMVRGREGLGLIDPRNVPDLIAYMRTWETPATWRLVRNVTENSPRAVANGRRLYREHCAGCHGPNGRGDRDGPGYFAPSLNNDQFLEAATDGFLLATIARGRRTTAMRPFAKGGGGIGALSADEMQDIVSFIRSWQAAGSRDHRRIGQ